MPFPDLKQFGSSLRDLFQGRKLQPDEIAMSQDIIDAGELDPDDIRLHLMPGPMDWVANKLNMGGMSWGSKDIMAGPSAFEDPEWRDQVMRHEMTHLAQKNAGLKSKPVPHSWKEYFFYNDPSKYDLPKRIPNDVSELNPEQIAMALEVGGPWQKKYMKSLQKEPVLSTLVRQALQNASRQKNPQQPLPVDPVMEFLKRK